MLRFIGDMFIGWVIFTDEGKAAVNNIMSKAYNHIKKNALNSEQLQELLSFKDIFNMDESKEGAHNETNKTVKENDLKK